MGQNFGVSSQATTAALINGNLEIQDPCGSIPSELGPGEQLNFEATISTNLDYLTEYTVGLFFRGGGNTVDFSVDSGAIQPGDTKTVSTTLHHDHLLDLFGAVPVEGGVFGTAESTIVDTVCWADMEVLPGGDDGTGGFTGERGVIDCTIPNSIAPGQTITPEITFADEDRNNRVGISYIGIFVGGTEVAITSVELRHGETATIQRPDIPYGAIHSAVGSGTFPVETRGVGGTAGLDALQSSCGQIEVVPQQEPPPTGCTSDSDCAGNNICVNGECVPPDDDQPPTEDGGDDLIRTLVVGGVGVAGLGAALAAEN